MHYLCKVIALKAPDLLDFHEDLVSLKAATKIQLKILAEEMEALISGLKKVKQELEACANDGPISEGFRHALKDFIGHADAEVTNVSNFYSVVGRNADALALYFGEDPARCPFEQATLILFNFVRFFRKSHEENIKLAEAEEKKAKKEIDMKKRANDNEIMLTKVKMPLPDIINAILAMDDTILDVDQVENILKFCPTKEEMEQLKNFTGDIETLGKCEQYFLELMKVPRMETKLNCFLFKFQFNTQVAQFSQSLNIVLSVCDEVRNSTRLKRIMQTILCLGNELNQRTASAVGFKLHSLLKLSHTRSSTSNMTLMHYLCKIFAENLPDLLNVHEDLVSLEDATKIQFNILSNEIQALISGLNKVKQELEACANDGPISEDFHQALKEFIGHADAKVIGVEYFYRLVGRKAGALPVYFGEDPGFPFEQVILTLFKFVRDFRKADEENRRMVESDN
ncbi:putative formin-like protein 15b [Rutidosis leptorrhynchoides]|uniref:putative formin-like protein 15b n=1 Tax=Rutidosis leptorrhynchoides TaxID=125765 RepID=UPI003A9A192B